MGRTRRDCPVFGCGSTNLARLANHLDQAHGMNTEERKKWLKWSKIGICVPRQSEDQKKSTWKRVWKIYYSDKKRWRETLTFTYKMQD